MERHEFPVDDRLRDIVDAVERGDEVVLVRDGKVVAEVNGVAQPAAVAPTDKPRGLNLEKLARIHALLGPMAGGDSAKLIREMREMDDH